MKTNFDNNELFGNGERYIPWLPAEDIGTIFMHFDHLGRYHFAKQFSKDKVILDLACGEGYGTNILAHEAKKVIGIDISQETVNFAKGKYAHINLEFILGNGREIPVEGKEIFDLICSFETLEHLNEDDQVLMINEFERLLKPDGLLIISTPNHHYTHNILKYDNPHHYKELGFNEFGELLSAKFSYRAFFGQRNYFSNQIAKLDEMKCSYIETVLIKGGEAYIDTRINSKIPQNYLCIASKKNKLMDINSALLIDSENTLVATAEYHIYKNIFENKELQRQVNDLQNRHSLQTEHVEGLQLKIEDLNAFITNVQSNIEEQLNYNEDLKNRLNIQTAHTDELQARLDIQTAQTDELQAQLDIQTTNANGLQAQLDAQLVHAYKLQIIINNITSSIIWRVTKPLRMVRQLFSGKGTI